MKLKLTSFIISALLVFSSTGCSKLLPKDLPTPPPESRPQVEESREYPVTANGATLSSRPGIIVSLSPSVTEKISDLGLQDRLEGISDYCDAPNGFERTRCGTVAMPDFDAIKLLSPHILFIEGEISERNMSELLAMGTQVATIPHAATMDKLKDNYLQIARLLDGDRTGTQAGEIFGKKLQFRLDGLVDTALTEPKNAVYLRLLDFTVATGDTLEGNLMEQIGLNNIANEQVDWTFDQAAATSADGKALFQSLDFIFCDERSVTIKMLENSAYYKGLNAVRKDYYLYIDSTAFERQTMRMFDELEKMSQYAKGEIHGSKDAIPSSTSEASAA